MISEHSKVELRGEYLCGVVEDGVCFLSFVSREMNELTPKQARKVLEEISAELSALDERIGDLGNLPKLAGLVERALEPPSLPIYEDVRALTSHHAREVAYRRFYADEANRGLVLAITSCEAVTRAREGEGVYRVSGFTKPRQKAVRGTLLPQPEGVAQDG
jgi:hypothetical protein